MNKKGYIRTLEAVIAIIIILVFVFTVIQPKYRRERESAEIELLQDVIINELEENNDYRNYILTEDQMGLGEIRNTFIPDMLGKINSYEKYDFWLHVQDAAVALSIPTEELPEDKKIYARGIIMSATIEEGYNPKIVVLYLWEK